MKSHLDNLSGLKHNLSYVYSFYVLYNLIITFLEKQISFIVKKRLLQHSYYQKETFYLKGERRTSFTEHSQIVQIQILFKRHLLALSKY